MTNINERPICHRAEDLVTYLYGEATQAEARDFSGHLEQCESCKAEFAVFRQVHDSILEWRSEALGIAPRPVLPAPGEIVPTALPVHGSTRLSAVAALRQFFAVSPLWLRGAAGFAAVLLFMLLGLSTTRLFQRPKELTIKQPSSDVYSSEQFKAAVAMEMERLSAEQSKNSVKAGIAASPNPGRGAAVRRMQTASNRQRGRRFSREELAQLAANLRLTPGWDDEEPPFVFNR